MIHAPLAQWKLGVIASALGSLLGALGGQLRMASLAQKAANREKTLQALGWTCWISGQLLGQVAIPLAPATAVACVTFSGSLLFNALLAPLVLCEELTRYHWIGVFLLCAGGGLVTLNTSHQDQHYSVAMLLAFHRGAHFVVIAVTCIFVMIALVTRALVQRKPLDMSSFAFVFALTGACDLLVTKFSLQLLRVWAWAKNVCDQPSRALVITALATMAVFHILVFSFQVVSTRYRQALLSVPLFLGSGAVLQVTLCGAYFQELQNLPWSSTVGFSVGLALMLAGMVVTSRASQADAAADHSKAGSDTDSEYPISHAESVLGQVPDFTPPTAASAHISSGLLGRSHSSMSSSDLVFLVDIQRSAMCFGATCYVERGRVQVQRPMGRKGGSLPALQKPFLSESEHFEAKGFPVAASAPEFRFVSGRETTTLRAN